MPQDNWQDFQYNFLSTSIAKYQRWFRLTSDTVCFFDNHMHNEKYRR